MNIPCATCGDPASCIGDHGAGAEPSCEECCGHDPNDVVCVPLEYVDPEALKAFEEVET